MLKYKRIKKFIFIKIKHEAKYSNNSSIMSSIQASKQTKKQRTYKRNKDFCKQLQLNVMRKV